MNAAQLITPDALSKLKGRAKKRKRLEGCPLHEAHRSVAGEAGFDDWDHITRSFRQWRALRARFDGSVVVAFDSREVEPRDYCYRSWQLDLETRFAIEDELWFAYRRSVNAQDPRRRTRKETESPARSRRRYLRRLGELVFLRYWAPLIRPLDERFDLDSTYFDEMPVDLIAALRMLQSERLGQPRHLWVGGHHLSPVDVPGWFDERRRAGRHPQCGPLCWTGCQGPWHMRRFLATSQDESSSEAA